MLLLKNVRLFDAEYTLDTVVADYKIPKGIMRTLLLSIYEQLNALDVDNIEEASQNLQKNFPKILYLPNIFLCKYISEFIKWGLLEKIDDGSYLLTDKSIEIFKRASSKQKELDEKGLSNF